MKRTRLFERHKALGAKMVDFSGWEMPIQYTSITEEHNAVRNKAGIFDISHMGQVYVTGPDAFPFLQNLTTNDLKRAAMGKGIYSHILNETGGIIDDIFIYCLEENRYLLIFNASRSDEDIKWISEHRGNLNVKINVDSLAAGFAIQGPDAIQIFNRLLDEPLTVDRFGIERLKVRHLFPWVARTGYTGEDGLELFGQPDDILQIWDWLMEVGKMSGLTPCGLGARDTLRTEVGYPLYGHELDVDHTPFEAGLGWVVKLDKGNFIGRDALLRKKSEGFTTQLVGFKVESGGIARHQAKIVKNGSDIGVVTSGTFSPSLGYPIGMAYVPTNISAEGAKLTIIQGTREFAAKTSKMPFFIKNTVAGGNPA